VPDVAAYLAAGAPVVDGLPDSVGLFHVESIFRGTAARLPCNPHVNNSANSSSKNPASVKDLIDARGSCPSSVVIRGRCSKHNLCEWLVVPCGKRGCPECGAEGRKQIAARLAYGVRELAPAAWLVLTFSVGIAAEAQYKPVAVRKLADFVRWLRRHPCRKGLPPLEYAATYELQKSGRLHINLLLAPWVKIPHAELYARWGARLSVEWVQDSEAMGAEAAKTYSPEALGGYLSKLYQAVPEEWGRRVSFSKNWPKLPESTSESQGDIVWTPALQLPMDILIGFLDEVSDGEWFQVAPGRWAGPERCNCFDLVLKVSKEVEQ